MSGDRAPEVPLPGADRPVAARGPGEDAGALRAAYLELLKLALCDLAGTGTTSVWRHVDGTLMSRELAGEDLRIRAAGVDWPLHGVTMVGLARLDQLQACVEEVLADGVAGDLLEAGTWRGGAAMLMRATLDAHGERARTVWVADSFQGFPQADELGLAPVDYLAVAEEDVRANFTRLGLAEGVRYVPGFFADTLPGLAGRTWSLLRLDGDSHEATWTALTALYPGLTVGGYVVIDDYGAVEACKAAVDEFRAVNGIDEPLEHSDWTGARWRRATDAPLATAVPAPAPGQAPVARAAPRERPRIVSMDERAALREARVARRELAELAERLQAAEREIAALRGAPLRALRSWIRARR
jgi:O-methyltransferase